MGNIDVKLSICEITFRFVIFEIHFFVLIKYKNFSKSL